MEGPPTQAARCDGRGEVLQARLQTAVHKRANSWMVNHCRRPCDTSTRITCPGQVRQQGEEQCPAALAFALLLSSACTLQLVMCVTGFGGRSSARPNSV